MPVAEARAAPGSPARIVSTSSRRPLERPLARAGARSRGRSAARSAPRRSGGRSSASSRSSHSLTSSRALSSARRVHAHVERRVGRVREAALGPVDLHATRRRGRAGSRRPARRCRRAAPSTTAKSPRRKPRLHAARAAAKRSKYGRTVGSRSIAISLPSPREVGGEQRARGRRRRRWRRRPSRPAAPRGARAPRPRGRERGQLALCCKTFGNIFRAPFDLLRAGRARRRGPRSRGGRGRRPRSPRGPSSACASSAAGSMTRPCLSSSASTVAPTKKKRCISRASRLSGSRPGDAAHELAPSRPARRRRGTPSIPRVTTTPSLEATPGTGPEA